MLNDSLAEIGVMMDLCKSPKSLSSISRVNGEIRKLLIDFEKAVNNKFEPKASFGDMAKILRIVKALDHFPLTSEHLPIYETLVDFARRHVSALADSIETTIEETAEVEKAEQLLDELRGAQSLNEFLGPDISSRLGALRKLLAKKETDVNELLESMIKKKDFRGMKDFLGPLSRSKDQLRKKKYFEYRSTIAESLEPAVTLLLHLVLQPTSEENLSLISDNMKILSDASSEIGTLMKFVYDVTDKFNTITTKVRNKVSKLLERVEAGHKRLDLVEMRKALIRANLYHDHLDSYFTIPLRKRREKCEIAYGKLMESMQSLVDAFIASEFKEERDLSVLLDNLESANPSELEELNDLHQRTAMYLQNRVMETLHHQKDFVASTGCYAEALETTRALNRALKNGLQKHLTCNFEEELDGLLESWGEARQQQEHEMDFGGNSASKNLDLWAKRLANVDGSAPSGSWAERLFGHVNKAINRDLYARAYRGMQRRLNQQADDWESRAEQALQGRDYVRFQECVEVLVLMNAKLDKHLPAVGHKVVSLQTTVRGHFLDLCETTIAALRSEDRFEIERLLPDYHACLLESRCLDTNSRDVVNQVKLTHQLMFELLNKKINSALQRMTTFEFKEMEASIKDARSFGHFVADHTSLFREQIRSRNCLPADPWLDDLTNLINVYFHAGRDLGGIKYFALLGIVPSSKSEEISKAFRAKSRKYHPDKCKDPFFQDEYKEKFQLLNQACEELERRASSYQNSRAQPFDKEIRGVGAALRKKVQEALKDQNYDLVESLFFNFADIKVLETLVHPELDTQLIEEKVSCLVKDHIQKARTKIESSWSEKNYQELNHNIDDLKLMEAKLNSSLFGQAWSSDGIVQTIEQEIVIMAKDARSLLRDKKTAKESRDDFRRCFMALGSVMVELPMFKAFTKSRMSEVLESCLSHDWGYGYLFEFGNGLQRDSDGVTSDEKRVAHIVLKEFSSFNDVMTMIWNEEVQQKPPEVTIPAIRVQRISDERQTPLEGEKQARLSESFQEFDKHYRSLLCDFLKSAADISVLVRKTIGITDRLKPITCKTFGIQTKTAIPEILACVFTVFTVLKSGESYNRLEQSSSSDEIDPMKVLMRPHNIQIQTLLTMFGCEDQSSTSVESQLMQIRTGEGKSMILGAASLVFGLLGFNVRCVCYSEYLSRRDYDAFRDVFEIFGLANSIKYSKITTLSEDSTSRKGDLRGLTLSLLRSEDRVISRRDPAALGAEPSKTFARQPPQSRSPGRAKDKTKSKVTLEGESGTSSVPNATAISSNVTTVEDGSSIDDSSDLVNSSDPGESVVSTAEQMDQTTAIVKNKTKTTLEVSGGSFGTTVSSPEQILLIDEVDVFFSSDFYGNTYNKAAMLREPEISEILKAIWAASNEGQKKVKLSFVKELPAYESLVQKLDGFEFVVENEVMRMLDEVRRLDESPYHLDISRDRIGHKVMDAIDYDVNYGYRTIFAYLKEKDNLQNPDATLQRELGIKVSCGQFSYANISPSAILGVSGTLEVMGSYEKAVLRRYGVQSFFFLPSVYGDSRFCFDKADPSSVSIEKGTNDYFQKISEVVVDVTRNKRAAIVFFSNTERLKQFTSSPFFRKLGRNKNVLTEDMTMVDKEFVIQRAATSGQITISTAVFGRGTDFFCKDETVESNGGVHVVQTFLSSELSEEVQIQGRTARQGKKGTFSMVLLDKDLREHFGADLDGWARKDYYKMLNEARASRHDEHCKLMESNLIHATSRDKASHEFFDAVLDGKQSAPELFKSLYLSIKKRPAPEVIDLDLCIALDNTGSMRPYSKGIKSTISSLIHGSNSFLPKLKMKFPDTKFKIRFGLLAYKDIDDGNDQFMLRTQPFCDDPATFLKELDRAVSNPSGGGDLCEDHLGALHFLSELNAPGCWESAVKILLLVTDAPCHSFLPASYSPSADAYNVRHPLGITAETVAEEILKKEIDVFLCSLNPEATLPFEEKISTAYFEHPENSEERRIISVPLVQKGHKATSTMGSQMGSSKHIIFVLDESGSMQHDWGGVVVAYNNYRKHRLDQQFESDLVSVVQFDDSARVTVQQQNIGTVRQNLDYHGGGTSFAPAATAAHGLALSTPHSHVPVVVFMSDGMTDDSRAAASIFTDLNNRVKGQFGDELELHVIGFGGGTDTSQLNEITKSSGRGRLHTTSNVAALSSVFVQIAGGSSVANVLEKEIGKRIYEAVSDRLSAEYAG